MKICEIVGLCCRMRENSGEGEHGVIPGDAGRRLGMEQMFNALVGGEPASDSKNVNRNQHRIKIQQLTVAEGMKRIRRAGAALHSEEQPKFVSSVGGGVKSFGEHRRTAGDGSGHVLGDRNRSVSGEPG
jgi:hypothetical protein